MVGCHVQEPLAQISSRAENGGLIARDAGREKIFVEIFKGNHDHANPTFPELWNGGWHWRVSGSLRDVKDPFDGFQPN